MEKGSMTSGVSSRELAVPQQCPPAGWLHSSGDRGVQGKTTVKDRMGQNGDRMGVECGAQDLPTIQAF